MKCINLCLTVLHYMRLCYISAITIVLHLVSFSFFEHNVSWVFEAWWRRVQKLMEAKKWWGRGRVKCIEVKWSEVIWSEDLWWKVCITIDLHSCSCMYVCSVQYGVCVIIICCYLLFYLQLCSSMYVLCSTLCVIIICCYLLFYLKLCSWVYVLCSTLCHYYLLLSVILFTVM
jgi:hypothetical protein